MAFKKLGFPLFVMMVIFLQLHLLPLHAHPLQNSSASLSIRNQMPDIKVNGDKRITRNLTAIKLKRIATVDRKAGGGGGHGGGHASHGDGNGGRSTGDSMHGTVVPLYAAGAMAHHPNNHHGSNKATPNCFFPRYLVLPVLAVSIIAYFG